MRVLLPSLERNPDCNAYNVSLPERERNVTFHRDTGMTDEDKTHESIPGEQEWLQI